MKSLSFASLFSLLSLISTAQSSELNFSSFELPIDSFMNGSDTGLYSSECFQWTCTYDTSFGGYWDKGIAISTMTDDSTGDYTNLYSAISGTGHEDGAYGVVSASSEVILQVRSACEGFYGVMWMGGYVTNSTYAYMSMLNGDQFAKKFGGASGDDPDYFFVRFRFYDAFPNFTDSVPMSQFDMYLADYRFEDNSKDYILDDWAFVQLNDYPAYENSGYRVSMQLYSSDTGMFGINTPGFFCIDDIVFDYPGAVAEKDKSEADVSVKVDGFEVSLQHPGSVRLYDIKGNLLSESNRSTIHAFSTVGFPQGIYILESEINGALSATKVFRW
ncbi:MAG: DUF4465 domain-containing protein [Cryomorphaceae bacterium]